MADDPSEPSVRINLSTIYAEVVAQGSKLDLVLSELHEVRSTSRETDTDHEIRIRKIEEQAGSYVTHVQARAWLAVILTVAAVVSGFVALMVHN